MAGLFPTPLPTRPPSRVQDGAGLDPARSCACLKYTYGGRQPVIDNMNVKGNSAMKNLKFLSDIPDEERDQYRGE